MARYTPDKIETVGDDKTRLRIIDKNFGDLSLSNNELDKSVSELNKKVNIKNTTVSDIAYRLSEHAIQLTLQNDVLASGATTIPWDVQDRIDHDYYEHSTTVNPSQITLKVAGDYRVTVKFVTDQPAFVRVIRWRNGVAYSIERSYMYLGGGVVVAWGVSEECKRYALLTGVD